MKILIILAIQYSLLVQAGTYLEKGLYIDQNLVIGYGKTREAAIDDAMFAIPKGYAVSKKKGSPAIQCADDHIWSELSECQEADVRYTLVLEEETKATK